MGHLMKFTSKLLMRSEQQYANKLADIRPANLLAIWPHWDSVGRTCVETTGKTVALDLVENGGFETLGGGGADIWALWGEIVGDGAIADENILVHSGSHAAKLTAGASRNSYVKASNVSSGGNGCNVIPGMACELKFWTRGDGTYAGRYAVYDNTNGGWIRSTVSTGISGTTYTEVTYPFTIPAGCYMILLYLWCPGTAGGISYFDDVSITCNYPLSGVYQPSGITYGEVGIGDGRTSTKHNGTDSGVLIGSKAFGSVWNGNIGSMISWGKVDAVGRWSDLTAYRYPLHMKSRQDATVYLVTGKTNTANTLSWRRRILNPQFEYTYTFPSGGTLNWFCQGFSWDISGNFKCYLYVPGEIPWTKLYDAVPTAGNEFWDNALYTCDAADTVLSAGSLTQQEWIGWNSYAAIWGGITLTDLEMRRAMNLRS